MRKLSVVMAMMAAFLAGNAKPALSAGFVNGKLLLDMCTGEKGMEGLACMGYTTALNDVFLMIGPSTFSICLPMNQSSALDSEVVLKYLESNPQALEDSAAASALVAYALTFPCKIK